MQQISSKQLKCYGRRNRAKPETATSSLESGPPPGRDVRGGSTVSEEVQAAAAASVEAAEVAVAQPVKHAGRGRPRKVVGAPKQVVKSPGDVGTKNVPTTRSSAGRLAAPAAGEVARNPTAVEVPGTERLSLRPAAVQAEVQGSIQGAVQAPVQAVERAHLRLRIVGPFSNGGSKHGKSKSLGSTSPGSQKTRGQIAGQEARRGADGEVRGDGAHGKQSSGREGNGSWQANHESGVDRDAGRERKDGEGHVVRMGDDVQAVSWQGADGKHERASESAGEQVVERRDEGQAATESRADGGSQREGDDAVEQAVESEVEVGATSHEERKGAEQVVMRRRDGAQSVGEKRVAGKPHRERRESGGEREGHAQGTLASRRRLVALQKRQREEEVLAEADDVLLKHEVRYTDLFHEALVLGHWHRCRRPDLDGNMFVWEMRCTCLESRSQLS